MNKKWSFWRKQPWVRCWFVCRTPTGSRWWLTERRVSWTSWTLQVRRSTAPWGISTWGQERASSVCLPSITPSPLRTFISTGVCWAEPVFLCWEFVLKYLFNILCISSILSWSKKMEIRKNVGWKNIAFFLFFCCGNFKTSICTNNLCWLAYLFSMTRENVIVFWLWSCLRAQSHQRNFSYSFVSKTGHCLWLAVFEAQVTEAAFKPNSFLLVIVTNLHDKLLRNLNFT